MTRILITGMAWLLISGSPDAEAAELSLEIRDHRFVPEELVAPSGEKIRLVIHNRDATPEEFESYELNREKVVSGNSSIRIFLPALEPGTYPFFGEFHPETARGRLIVK
jgi:plastocyanin